MAKTLCYSKCRSFSFSVLLTGRSTFKKIYRSFSFYRIAHRQNLFHCASNLVCLFLLTACRSCRYCKNLFVTLHTLYFLWRMFDCPIIPFVLSEEYVTQLSQSNENASLTSLHTSYIWCAVEPLLIIGMSSNDGAVNSESLLTCLTKMGKI